MGKKMTTQKRKDYYQIGSLQGRILATSNAGYFLLASRDDEWHSVNCDASRMDEIKNLLNKTVLFEVKQLLDIETDKPIKTTLEGKITVVCLRPFFDILKEVKNKITLGDYEIQDNEKSI